MVTGIKAGVGTEGLTGLENPVQQTDAPGFETVGIEGVGRTGLPKRQKVVAKAHHMGVGDVFEPQVKGVGQGAAGLLGAENAAIKITTGLFLRLPALGAHETVAEAHITALEAQGGDHAVAIKGVVDPMAGALQAARSIAIQGAVKASRNGAPRRLQRHRRQLAVHVAKSTRPLGALKTQAPDGAGIRGELGCCSRGTARGEGHRCAKRRGPRCHGLAIIA